MAIANGVFCRYIYIIITTTFRPPLNKKKNVDLNKQIQSGQSG